MITVRNDDVNPYFNLALEEYLTRNMPLPDNCFMLWQNRPAIIVGRNQYAPDEINAEFVEQNQVAVVRRMTGGGAVYHDLGNLNYTFIVTGGGEAFLDFASFARPVVAALGRLGVKAEAEGRNDITIDGLKVSGTAQYQCRDRILHHGTLLFDSNLDNLTQALNVSADKIAGKGVASVRSRVTNIREHLPMDLSMEEFKLMLAATIPASMQVPIAEYFLTEEDFTHVDKLRRSKYEAWEWNYGELPAYNVRRQKRLDWGKVDVRLNVEGGLITGCRIYGDFFGTRSIAALEQLLTGTPYEESEILRVLAGADLPAYIHGFDAAAMIKLLFPS